MMLTVIGALLRAGLGWLLGAALLYLLITPPAGWSFGALRGLAALPALLAQLRADPQAGAA